MLQTLSHHKSTVARHSNHIQYSPLSQNTKHHQIIIHIVDCFDIDTEQRHTNYLVLVQRVNLLRNTVNTVNSDHRVNVKFKNCNHNTNDNNNNNKCSARIKTKHYKQMIFPLRIIYKLSMRSLNPKREKVPKL